MANEFNITPQGAVPQVPARFFPAGPSTATAQALRGVAKLLDDQRQVWERSSDALAVTEYNKQAAILNMELLASPTGAADQDIQGFQSHQKLQDSYLEGLTSGQRERIEPRIAAVTTSHWIDAAGRNYSRMRQESKDSITAMLTSISTFGPDMNALELESLAGEAQVAIADLGAQGEETKTLTQKLARTFKNVRIERGKRMADADLVGVDLQNAARMGGAVDSLENFRAAYGADLNETHWKRYAAAYDAKIKAEEREQRRVLRENAMDARLVRGENERYLMASVTNAAGAFQDTVAVAGKSPAAPVDWEGLEDEFLSLQGDAEKIAAQGGKSAARFVETSPKILEEIRARKEAQALLMSGPGGARALAERSQEIAASDAPIGVKRAYLDTTRSVQSFVEENGAAALAAAQRGTGVKPLTAKGAWEEARTIRDEYPGSTGVTKSQASNALTSVIGEDRRMAVATLEGMQRSASVEDRAYLADEVRGLADGSATERSIFAGVVTSNLTEKDQTALTDGLARLKQGEWMNAEKLMYGSDGLSNSMREKLTAAFPDPVQRNDAINAATALYLGQGGGTMQEFERDDWWEKAAPALWAGEDFESVNGRETLVPKGVDMLGSVRSAGETGLRLYGNGDPDLGGERFEAFLSEAKPLRVAPGKYAFIGANGGVIKLKDSPQTYILDLEELRAMNPEVPAPPAPWQRRRF